MSVLTKTRFLRGTYVGVALVILMERISSVEPLVMAWEIAFMVLVL